MAPLMSLLVSVLALGVVASPSSRASAGLAAADARTERAERGDRAGRVTDWAPARRSSITPGSMMYTAGAQCTANFVFTDAAGGVYVGYAAHCAGTGEATDTDGCDVSSLPIGTRVDFVRGGSPVDGGTRLGRGRLAYSSWLAMDEVGTTDGPTCAYNDFALVKVRPRAVRRVNPTVPFFGGPTGVDRSGTRAGERVFSYGNSSLRAGLSALSPKTGIALGDATSDRGWSHGVYTVTPGIPGDSGSGFHDRRGQGGRHPVDRRRRAVAVVQPDRRPVPRAQVRAGALGHPGAAARPGHAALLEHPVSPREILRP